ncbi:MAG: hypothetical protein HY905_02880 [Deltaproteobacteria bacterium]|nr:hypothetical protein [Deltaproteobacteria bacterium]
MAMRGLYRVAAAAVLAAGLGTGCGDHVELDVDGVTALRLADDRVELTVAVSPTMHAWSAADEYCIGAVWFRPGAGGGGDCADPSDFAAGVDAELGRAESCQMERIDLRGSATHVLTSAAAVPAASDLRVTVSLERGDTVREDTPIILRGPMTICSP